MKKLFYLSFITLLVSFFALPANAFFGATPSPSRVEASVTPTAKKSKKKQKKVKKKKHKKTKKHTAAPDQTHDDGLELFARFVAISCVLSGSLLFTAGTILIGALTGLTLVGFIVLIVGSALSMAGLTTIAFVSGVVLGFTMFGLGLALASPLLWITGISLAVFMIVLFFLSILFALVD